jgi:hypothetical protein
LIERGALKRQSLSRSRFASWHQREHRRFNRHDRFALLFGHVLPRIKAGHAFVVMVQERLYEVDRQTRRLRDCRSRSAEVVGREGRELFRKPLVGHDAANGLAEPMTGKRRQASNLLPNTG